MELTEEIRDFWACTPAGGMGTRLWPLSRSEKPKFLLDATGSGRSLVQGVFDRMSPLCSDRFVVVTGSRYASAVLEQLPGVPMKNILSEPSARDSMAAIGYAAAYIELQDPDAIMGSFPADHVIPDAEPLRACVREAVEVARTGRLCLVGIKPTFPTPGLGYIRMGDDLGVRGAPSACLVARFAEKPDRETARRYVQDGYRWNGGMWIAKAGVLLDLLSVYRPRMTELLRALVRSPERFGDIWSEIEKTTIDKAVAEPAAREGLIAVVPVDMEWDDVGDYEALSGVLPNLAGEPIRYVGGEDGIVAVGSSGLVINRTGRLIALLGLEDVVVVDTEDVLLLTKKELAHDVREIVVAVGLKRPDLL